MMLNQKNILLLSLLFTLFSCVKKENPVAIIHTELGDIQLKIYMEKAPVTANNFIQYIENDYFAGSSFYRVVRPDNQPGNDIKIEVIQGGLGFDVEDSPIPPIIHETTQKTGIQHLNGTISMARAEPGTASSEFFICIGEQPELDFGGKRNPDGQGFAAFGKVIDGMEVVKKIQNQKDNEQFLVKPVKIMSIEIVK